MSVFKSILPHKRQASFDIVNPTTPAEKDTPAKHPLANVVNAGEKFKPPPTKKRGKEAPPSPKLSPKGDGTRLMETGAMNRAFEKMLDDMQIPSTLRPKLTTLDSPVKAAMLKSSQVLSQVNPAFPSPQTPTLRRTKSIESISTTPTPPFAHTRTTSMDSATTLNDVLIPPRPISANFGTGSSFGSSSSSLSRNSSVEFLPATAQPPNASTDSLVKKQPKASKDKRNPKDRELQESAEAMSAWLASTKSTTIEVDKLKRLRLLLRNESAAWSETFLIQGGYSSMLSRLNELLEVEWREEQHDDQALHELLRCFKALSTSSIGCFALRSVCPTPFAQLVKLLYSDKKPGDVATRQLIADLLLILYELYAPTLTADDSSSVYLQRRAWEVKDSGHVIPPARPTVFTKPNAPPPPLPAPHTSIYSLLRAVLLTPKPAPSDNPNIPVDPHAFIAELHKPRIYKTYLQEMSDVRRDYFWVFCHPQNTIWDLVLVDEEKVEKPKAPGGMTGGVEFEAMAYLTAHVRLVNTLCKAAADLTLPPEDEQSAYKLHADLFASGLEKIILTARKSSTVYYPNLHLEIGRYIAHAVRAKFELPYSISRLIGPPPVQLLRRKAIPDPRLAAPIARPGPPLPPRQGQLPAGSRPPSLPPPRPMDQIQF